MVERWEISSVVDGMTTECKYFRGDFQIYRFTAPTIEIALSRLNEAQRRLFQFPVQINNRGDVNGNIVGRAIYYRECPAFITQFDGERGQVMIRPDNPEKRFPPEPWDGEKAESWTGGVWEDLLSPKIYWHREEGE